MSKKRTSDESNEGKIQKILKIVNNPNNTSKWFKHPPNIVNKNNGTINVTINYNFN
jgi:hypothetical protein